jgi:eukaryotic-like serine/threonine-protein kinase
LFEQALEVSQAERKAFLDRACNGEESLRSEVESLLANHEQAESFLEEPPGEIAAEFLTSEGSWFATGQSINHYTVIEFLGAGGMGEVYLAEDPRLSRRVAIKALPRPFVSNDDRVRRFEQEARAASALNHPNIVTIHEVGKAGDAHFIVSEFIDGKTLSERLARSGPMNVGEALDVALQVANALEAAHAAGIVHRDVKPDNIMIRPDGLVKVLDFGLAKLSEPERFAVAEIPTVSNSPGRNTNLGPLMGTVRYMSPEQARGEPIDARADVWSLGVVLFEMVAGVPPFDGTTRSQVIAEVLDEAVPRLAAHVKDIPPALERIVGKSLSKNPDERYQTSKDFATDLKNLRVQLEHPGSNHGSVHVPSVLERRKSRKWWKVGGIAAAVAVLLIVGAAITKRIQAHQLYLQGRAFFQKPEAEGAWKSLPYFQKAVSIDPNYAPPYAALADCYGKLANLGEMRASEAWAQSEEFAVKSATLDPNFGPAHRALGAVRMWFDYNWVDAEKEFKKAIELEPEAASYRMYARMLGAIGRFDDAIKAKNKEREADPGAEGPGSIYFLARKYDLAIEEFKNEIAENRAQPQRQIALSEAYVQQGRFGDALSEARKVRHSFKDVRPRIRLGVVFAASGEIEDAKKILEEGEKAALERNELNYFIAALYVALKDNDKAILWLSKAFDEHSNAVIDLNFDPRFDGLRQDPRFEELLGRLKLVR